MMVMLGVSAGCNPPQSVADLGVEPLAAMQPSSADALATKRPVEIDAGIVLADRSGYLCLPLERVGLPPDAEIVSMHTSCECVKPQLVDYLADQE